MWMSMAIVPAPRVISIILIQKKCFVRQEFGCGNLENKTLFVGSWEVHIFSWHCWK